jgi:hypothetical protein
MHLPSDIIVRLRQVRKIDSRRRRPSRGWAVGVHNPQVRRFLRRRMPPSRESGLALLEWGRALNRAPALFAAMLHGSSGKGRGVREPPALFLRRICAVWPMCRKLLGV